MTQDFPQLLPTIRLYFCFQGDSFDPDEITRRLEIEPTTSFRPGDPITEDGEGRRHGYGWMLKGAECEALEIGGMLAELQKAVDVPASIVRQLCSDLRVEPRIICGVGQDKDAVTTPTLFFPLDFLYWATEMGASIDVDVIL